MTSIEWTDKTWNPVVGCSRVSKGCEHCYAEGVAHRGMTERHRGLTVLRPGGKGPRWNGVVRMVPEVLDVPLRRKKPTRYFVNSMSDLFREELVGYEVAVEHVTNLAVPFWTVRRADGRPVGSGWTAVEEPGGKARLEPGALVFYDEAKAQAKAAEIRSAHEDGRRFIAAVFGVMAASPQHTFQILTKRPEQARRWFEWLRRQRLPRRPVTDDGLDAPDGARVLGWERVGDEWQPRSPHECMVIQSILDDESMGATVPIRLVDSDPSAAWPLPNVWIGVSVEDQATADARIPVLLELPAAVRFLSCEPLLGPVDLDPPRCEACGPSPCDHDSRTPDGLPWCSEHGQEMVHGEWLPGIDWVIAGGESGNGARPMHPDWARSLRDQCVAAGVPFLFKQHGAWTFEETATRWSAGGPIPEMFEDPSEVLWMTTQSSTDPKRVGERTPYILDGDRARRGWKLGKKKAGRELDGRTWDQFPRESNDGE